MAEFQPLDNRTPVIKPDGSPTDYFIRYMQQRLQDVGDYISAKRRINTGDGLEGGGDLSNDLTLTLAALFLNSLQDVDVDTTPPEPGQALIYDDEQGLWVPGDVASGGGGGGAAMEPSVVIQQKCVRQTGNFNITLDAAPKPGNVLVLLWTGAGGVTGSRFTADGFARVNTSWVENNDQSEYGQRYQGGYVAIRYVKPGDDAIYAVRGGTDHQNFALIEMDSVAAIGFTAAQMAVEGNTFRAPFFSRLACPSLNYVFLEHDGTGDITFAVNPSVTPVFQFTGTSNHRAALAKVGPTFAGEITGTMVSPNQPAQYFFNFAKHSAGGGGGGGGLDNFHEKNGHMWWRVRILSVAFAGNRYTSITRLGMYVAGDTRTDLAQNAEGYPIANGRFNGTFNERNLALGNARIRDNNTRWAAPEFSTPGSFAGYKFEQKVCVGAVSINCGDTPAEAPRSFVIEWSDDGSAWNEAASYADVAWTPWQFQLFQVPGAPKP